MTPNNINPLYPLMMLAMMSPPDCLSYYILTMLDEHVLARSDKTAKELNSLMKNLVETQELALELTVVSGKAGYKVHLDELRRVGYRLDICPLHGGKRTYYQVTDVTTDNFIVAGVVAHKPVQYVTL